MQKLEVHSNWEDIRRLVGLVTHSPDGILTGPLLEQEYQKRDTKAN
jgi:hypothetical protein